MLCANLITVLLRHVPSILPICLMLSLAYVIFLGIRAAVVIRQPESVAPVDLLLCRWCWAFILLPVTAFLTTAYTMEAKGLDPNKLIFGYDTGWLIFQFAMEAGLVFSVATLWSPRTVKVSSPRIVWKILAVPAILIHGFYVLGSLTRGFGQALEKAG